MPLFATKTDAAASQWRISDEVIRLREWATDTTYWFPGPPATSLLVGAADTCALSLVDPSKLTSREHAMLERRDVGWVARDLGSKNGIRLDGSRRPEVLLEPGAELGIGGLTLLAESRLFVELRGFMARLLGWGTEQLAAVDLALRAVRLAATRRAPLVLCGDEDLPQIAAAIHRHALGAERPFITSNPRRIDTDASVRAGKNAETGMAALHRARGGSLCVFSSRLPRDFKEVRETLKDPSTQVQLVVCADKPRESKPYQVEPIVVPPLKSRRPEIPRVIAEYAEEAALELAATFRLGSADRDWVLKYSATSISEIDKGTRRLLAIRQHDDNITAAARALGMAVSSLRGWIGRRALPGWKPTSPTPPSRSRSPTSPSRSGHSKSRGK